MKKSLFAFGLLIVVAFLASAALPVNAIDVAPPTIEVSNLPDGILELAVGESYTFTIKISSDEPFILAATHGDAYYVFASAMVQGAPKGHPAAARSTILCRS